MPIFFFEENDDGTSHVARAVLLRETNLLRHMLEVHCHYFIALHSTSLHYTALHRTSLHYTALHCTTLHYTALHCTTQHFTTLQCTALHFSYSCSLLHQTVLHCLNPALYYLSLHYTATLCTILHYIALHCTMHQHFETPCYAVRLNRCNSIRSQLSPPAW